MQRWTLDISGVRLPQLAMNSPELRPKNRAKRPFTRGHLQNQFAKSLVERRRQPLFRSVENRLRPEDSGVGLIILARQSWQGKRPIQWVAQYSDWPLKLHDGEIRDSLRRLLQVIFAGVEVVRFKHPYFPERQAEGVSDSSRRLLLGKLFIHAY